MLYEFINKMIDIDKKNVNQMALVKWELRKNQERLDNTVVWQHQWKQVLSSGSQCYELTKGHEKNLLFENKTILYPVRHM